MRRQSRTGSASWKSTRFTCRPCFEHGLPGTNSSRLFASPKAMVWSCLLKLIVGRPVEFVLTSESTNSSPRLMQRR